MECVSVQKKAQDIPDVQFNKDKLSLLFGNREVDQMHTKLQNQKIFHKQIRTLQKVRRLQMRMKANSEVDLPTPKSSLVFAYVIVATC